MQRCVRRSEIDGLDGEIGKNEKESRVLDFGPFSTRAFRAARTSRHPERGLHSRQNGPESLRDGPPMRMAFAHTSAHHTSFAQTLTCTRSEAEGSPVRGSMRWCAAPPVEVVQLRFSVVEVASEPRHSSAPGGARLGRAGLQPRGSNRPPLSSLPWTRRSPPAFTRRLG